jgi:hypothetical protein
VDRRREKVPPITVLLVYFILYICSATVVSEGEGIFGDLGEKTKVPSLIALSHGISLRSITYWVVYAERRKHPLCDGQSISKSGQAGSR